MKKAVICTLILWSIALFGYAQSFSVPMPKGLQCSNVPTWPLNHTTKKSNTFQINGTSKTGTASNTPAARPVTAVPALPFIKLWLMTESNNKDDDN